MGDVFYEDLEFGFDDSSQLDSDYEYEYDAPNFFDFSLPELQSEAEVAERWFRSASTYFPSYRLLQKSKPKSPSKPYLPKSSTLLKPTASHLAKLCRPDDQPIKYTGRSPKNARPLNNSWEVDTTARQKLEIGHSKKKQAAHLRGQSSFALKSPKTVRTNSLDLAPLKSKFTTPKGPDLETDHRIQRHRSINVALPDNIEKSKHCNCKVRPINRKIMVGPSLVHGRRSAPYVLA